MLVKVEGQISICNMLLQQGKESSVNQTPTCQRCMGALN
jgi:hypothetical protein